MSNGDVFRMHFVDQFSEELLNANEKYLKNIPTKGDNWHDSPIGFLQNRLHEELQEYDLALTTEDEYDELMDVICFALMLAKKTREKIEQQKG